MIKKISSLALSSSLIFLLGSMENIAFAKVNKPHNVKPDLKLVQNAFQTLPDYMQSECTSQFSLELFFKDKIPSTVTPNILKKVFMNAVGNSLGSNATVSVERKGAKEFSVDISVVFLNLDTENQTNSHIEYISLPNQQAQYAVNDVLYTENNGGWQQTSSDNKRLTLSFMQFIPGMMNTNENHLFSNLNRMNKNGDNYRFAGGLNKSYTKTLIDTLGMGTNKGSKILNSSEYVSLVKNKNKDKLTEDYLQVELSEPPKLFALNDPIAYSKVLLNLKLQQTYSYKYQPITLPTSLIQTVTGSVYGSGNGN